MVKRIISILLLLSIGLVAAPPSAPANVTYVYSDSMEPTIPEDGGYILGPADRVQPGDIVTFRSTQRDEYVTHRIVDRTSQGFITKGDNNQDTDQAAGHPYVQHDQIVGEVVTVGGKPLLIPQLGTAVTLITQYTIPIQILIGGVLLLSQLLSDGGVGIGRNDGRSRSIERMNDIAVPLVVMIALLLVVLLVGAPMLNQQTQTFVATSGDTSGPKVVEPGETTTHNVTLNQSSSPLMTSFVTVDGATVVNRSRDATTLRITERITAPTDIGPLEVTLTTYTYPSLLPYPLLASLHYIHPVIAALGTVFALFGPLIITYTLLIDGQRPVRESRSRWTRKFKRL